MSRLSNKTLLIILFFLLIPIVFLLKINQNKSQIYAQWWNESWMYRQSINISSHTSAESNVYITTTINIGTTNKSQIDNGDFRFTNLTGDLYSYYIVSGAGTTAITFHIQLDSFPSGAQTIYAYYGNSSAENGFSTSDFSTEASNYTIGSLSAEETGGAPIAYWKFDEGVGTTTHDSSGTSHGSLSGATWESADQCISGTCLFFIGGGSASVDTSLNTNLLNPPVTFSVWFKTLSNVPTDQVIIGGYSGSNDRWDITYNRTNNKKAGFLYHSGSGSVYTSTTISLNAWHQLTVIHLGSTISIYLDGKFENSTSFSDRTLQSGTYLKFGKMTGQPYGLSGYIDDVKVYPYARSATQIKSDYLANKSGQSSSNKINTSFGSSTSKSLTDGLVGYWKFDEGTGVSVTDYSDYAQNLGISWKSAVNPSPWATGKWGYAFQDAGYEYSNDEAAGSSWKGPTLTDFSVSLWFNPSSTAPLTTSSGYIVSRWWSDCDNTYPPGWAINYSYSTKKVNFKIAADNCGPDGNLSTGASFSPNTWYHLVATHKTGESLKMYVNGILDSQTSYTLGLNSSAPALNFGCNTNNNNCGYPGLTDEARIYNRVLSTDEIQQLYKYNPNPSSHSSPIAWYKFDEGVGTTVHNSGSIGSSANATLSGSTLPTWSNGKINKALYFDGSTSKISLGSTLNYPNITISTWIKPETPIQYYPSIFSNLSYGEDKGYILTFSSTSLSSLSFYVGNESIGTTLSGVTAGNWYYLTATWDGSIAKIYVDNKIVASGSLGTPTGYSGAIPILGEYSTNYHYKGIIDDFKIYDYALSEDEIKNDYNQSSSFVFGTSNQTIGGTTTSLEYCVPGSTDYCIPPIGEWNFEDGTGTTAYDTSGNNYSLPLGAGNSSPSFVPGKIGKSLSFQGNDYVGYQNTILSNTGPVTVQAWIKTNTSNQGGIVSRYGNSGAYNYRLYLNSSTGKVSFNRGNGTWDNTLTSTNALNNNQWHFISGVHDANTMYLYIDGRLDTSIGQTGTAGVVSNWWFMIGNDSYSPAVSYGHNFFNGLIDQVRIYNYARSPAQIAYDYNKGAPIAYWKLDECQGSIVHDSSGLGNTGAITIGAGGSQVSLGTCSLGETTAWGVGATGKFNSSLNFDGTDDYVTVTNNNSLKFGSNDFTISLWTFRSGTGLQGGSYISKGAYTTGFDTYDNIFRVNTSTGELAHVTFSASPNTWQNHIFVVTQTSTPYIKHYINGVLNNSGYSGVGNTGTFNSDNYDIHIGHSSAGGLQRYYVGKMDDVRIYNYGLTQQQINQVYNGGATNFN